MRTIAALLAAFPLVTLAQDSAQPAHAEPPPTYAPPPQQYAPPPQQYAPPPATPAPMQFTPPTKQRGSWYIGFGLGGGNGTVDMERGSLDFEDMLHSSGSPFAFNFRVGATISPRLLLGFDGGFVGSSADESGYSSSVQLNYYDVGLMYFPVERGLFLRAAAGLSSIVWDMEPYGESTASGFNVVGGLGYALWLGRTFNLTLNVDATRHWFDEPGLDGATAWSAWLGFDWY